MANYTETARPSRQVQPISREIARRVAERLEAVAARMEIPLDWWAVILGELLPEAYADRADPSPTPHPPGSKEKRRELRQRAVKGTALHHPGDNLAVAVAEGDRPVRVGQRGHYGAARTTTLAGRRLEGSADPD